MEQDFFENAIVKSEPLIQLEELAEMIRQAEESFAEYERRVMEIMREYCIQLKDAMEQFGEKLAEMLTPIIIEGIDAVVCAIDEMAPVIAEVVREKATRGNRLTLRDAPRKIGNGREARVRRRAYNARRYI